MILKIYESTRKNTFSVCFDSEDESILVGEILNYGDEIGFVFEPDHLAPEQGFESRDLKTIIKKLDSLNMKKNNQPLTGAL